MLHAGAQRNLPLALEGHGALRSLGVIDAELVAAVVSTRASVAIYANDGGDTVELPLRSNMGTNTRYQFVLLYTVGEEALQAAAEDVTAAVRDGALPVGEEAGLPLHRYSLEQTAAAHDAVEGGVTGKVLIDVAQG